MGSNSEKGHGKNAANFGKLASYCSSLGTEYNPVKPELKLAALHKLSAEADNSLAAINTAFTANSAASAARETGFKPLKKLVTRTCSSFRSCGTTAEQIQKLESIAKKLLGRRTSARLTEDELKELAAATGQKKQVSSLQLSFDSQILNLDKFIKMLASVPRYAPNETALQASTLEALYSGLKTLNAAASASETALTNARTARDRIMYTDEMGLADVAADVKEYLKSLEGSRGPKYKAISKLKFIKIKPKYSLNQASQNQ